ncbi:MAG TPA: hypothetical protein ENI87_08825, partial [bacterium]|nr:hypothetical protein [bacterium]
MPPASVGNLPWGERPADRLCLSARQAVERGEPERALVQIATVLDREPDHVDANRLRQDVLRTRGRRGLLLTEARRRVRQRPADGIAHYLLARVTEDPAAKLRGFERAAELSPGSVWPWLGLAHTLRASDRGRAIAIYERLLSASGRHPLVAIAYAAALRGAERYEAAEKVYELIRPDPRVPGVGDLGKAQVALAQDQRGPAWAALLQALRQRPYDSGVRALVRAWLQATATAEQKAQLLDVLREDGDRLRTFRESGGGALLADLLIATGQPLAARRVLRDVLARGASAADQRAYRRMLLRLGDVDAFLGVLARQVPRAVVDDERNRLRARWLRLLRGPWRNGGALADRDRAEALLVALRDVGLLVEAELCAEVARARWPEHDELWTRLQDEVRRELAFEAGLRRLLYQGYRRGDTAALAEVVERIRALSRRVLGRDCVGEVHRYSAPLIGTLLDPFRGGLAEHLARYNRHLVLGRRAGGTVEGLLVVRLSLRELGEQACMPLRGQSYEVIGWDREVRALGGVLGSDLAGVALLNHYLIDYDAVVDWANGLRT